MSPAAPLPLDTLAQQLTALGMEHAATALPELIETAAREHLDPSAFLGRVLTHQLERKDERRIATMLTLSGLRSGKTLETFDWGFQPKADRRQLEALAKWSFVREWNNVPFLGLLGWATTISPAASASRRSRTAFPRCTSFSMIYGTRSGPTRPFRHLSSESLPNSRESRRGPHCKRDGDPLTSSKSTS